jgi:Cu(I)/Ag(I) efflux system membrane protein CusA/SilA
MMFVLLGLGLGKWWLALVVFFGILVSASGGFAMLFLLGVNLSVAVWVGFIALFGVADDASVVILSFLENRHKEARPADAASLRELVVEATLVRIRPLLMTTVTTVVGLLPLFLTYGRGSDLMQPMAIPSVGGMAVQIITFLTAPCLYCLVMEWQLRRGLTASEPAASAAGGATDPVA